MGILNKAMIEKWILPHLPIGTRGFDTTISLSEIVECIFHRLKTGWQWRELPTKEFYIFDSELYRDRSVIEHANVWIDGFKALLVRFEFSVKNWMSLHLSPLRSFSCGKSNEKPKFKQIRYSAL